MDFDAKRPAKAKCIEDVDTLYTLSGVGDIDIKSLQSVVESKNIYLYKPEIAAIIASKGEGFDGKKFAKFCHDLGIINPGEPRTIGGGGGSRLTADRAKEVAPGNEKKYLELAKVLEDTRDAINKILVDHKWDFALKSTKKKEEVKEEAN